MAEPHWTSYVGMFTGIVGCLTGFAGYLKAKELATLDLRLSLKKSINALKSDSAHLKTLIAKAMGLKKATAAANGILKSSYMESWELASKLDNEKNLELLTDLPEMLQDLDVCNQSQLEKQTSKIHERQLIITRLIEKYEEEYKTDSNRNKGK